MFFPSKCACQVCNVSLQAMLGTPNSHSDLCNASASQCFRISCRISWFHREVSVLGASPRYFEFLVSSMDRFWIFTRVSKNRATPTSNGLSDMIPIKIDILWGYAGTNLDIVIYPNKTPHVHDENHCVLRNISSNHVQCLDQIESS